MGQAQNPERARLRGWQLAAARLAWGATILLAIRLVLAGYPHVLSQAAALSAQHQAALVELGLPAGALTTYYVGLNLAALAAFFVVAAVIFVLRSDDRMAIFTSFMLVTFGMVVTQLLMTTSRADSAWSLPARLLYFAGLSSFLTFIYIVPNGQFLPRWTRPAAIIYAAWTFATYFFPGSRLDMNALPPPLPFIAQLGWYASSVAAQRRRERDFYTPVENQQTKWIKAGLLAALAGFILAGLSSYILPYDYTDAQTLVYQLIISAASALCMIAVPLSIGFSILHYRLWDIDIFINRALVYSAVTTTLGAIYVGSVVLLQKLFQALIGRQSELAIILSTLAIAALFRPWRQRLQNFIDRRFYREQVDFRQTITSFSREVRAIIELPELLRALVNRTTDLLHIKHGAILLRGADGTFHLAQAINLPDAQAAQLPREIQILFLDRLERGAVVSRSTDPLFPLLVPLMAPRSSPRSNMTNQPSNTPYLPPSTFHLQHALVGILALGPRLSGQGYASQDQDLLLGLADQAGTAIYVARLVEEKNAEEERKEEAERQLEAYRNSPIGRAEAAAQRLLAQPAAALLELHRLAQAAGRDPQAADIFSNMPQVLAQKNAPADQMDFSMWLAGVAEGYNYLLSSHISPELLPVGLRTLITILPARAPTAPLPQTAAIQGAAQALALYQLGQAALDANSISQITQLSDLRLKIADISSGDQSDFLADLAQTLGSLQAVIDALRAYERVDTAQDKLAYLANAVDRLRHIDRKARADLGHVDRPVARRIIESWLGIVTGAISELQTRAQLACQLLTRHTWLGDIILLALNVRNEGRGAALNLRVSLAPAPEYTAVEKAAQIERLAPGEEALAELRVRLSDAGKLDQFRARFVIQYADPRGPDQVENFADVIYLLATQGEFQFIPNPYVVGTPLQTGSPLFFGREDVIAFIQDNLSAAHRNNLVLIGQRRTGKTSLLKQLPARLGQEYLPVYLDGQSLALDPGLPNFFLALATEITFAVQDGGFDLEPPEADEFANSPAATFEHKFLARAREIIGSRHLLLLLDEFEELEASVRRGCLDESVFGFLRHMVQHSDNLSVIFCGTHRLEELSADYWSVLFNISLYRHIAYLEQAEALRLIQEPVAAYGMRYDDLALDKIWRVTAGHPYFLQLMCHSLVNRHNKTQRNYVTIADVNAALEEILASGEAHFVYLWSGSTFAERLALTALSRMMPLTGQATPVQVLDYLTERGISIERQEVSEAMHRLTLRDILSAHTGEADAALGETYRWELGLVGLWVEKYKSLSRVVDEASI